MCSHAHLPPPHPQGHDHHTIRLCNSPPCRNLEESNSSFSDRFNLYQFISQNDEIFNCLKYVAGDDFVGIDVVVLYWEIRYIPLEHQWTEALLCDRKVAVFLKNWYKSQSWGWNPPLPRSEYCGFHNPDAWTPPPHLSTGIVGSLSLSRAKIHCPTFVRPPANQIPPISQAFPHICQPPAPCSKSIFNII